MKKKPIIGILLGNSAGVGPELVARLAVNRYYDAFCHPLFIGDVRMFQHALKLLKQEAPYQVVDTVDAIDWESTPYPFYDLHDQDPTQVLFGEASRYTGQSDLHQLDTAVAFCKAGVIDGFVFGPFHKGAMKLAGMHEESEHTYLAHAFGLTSPFCEVNMMEELMTVRATSHIPISEIQKELTEQTLKDAIVLAQSTSEQLVDTPRIAVAALNPHCGEFGLCGREEVDLIQPVIADMVQQTGWNITGPYSADTLFIEALRGAFDVVVTMYHDQGQIALKLVGFERCITVAGGQPYPIATCAHGTAFDKVGKGLVSLTSFERAVCTVSHMAQRQSKAR